MDVNSLFARAEQAFLSGRLDAARADLIEVQRLAGSHPAVLHLFALVEKKRGATEAAANAFRAALRLAPRDPQINNNFANLLDDLGDTSAALVHFDRAITAAADFADGRYNRALLLQKLGRLEEALADLDRLARSAPPSAKIQSARGGVLRQLGRLDEAAEAYDAALRLEPRRAVALRGRARVALERGDEQASADYRRALEAQPQDLELHLGLAEALEAEGDSSAVEFLATTVQRHPTWAEGQAVLARMRWEAGEGLAFTRALEEALKRTPGNRDLWFALTSALGSADLHAEAADAAACGGAAAGKEPALQLLEALHASESGDLARADRLFAVIPAGVPERSITEARHRIRTKEYERALALADQARTGDEWNVTAWALTGLLWRLTGESRAEWLHGQPGLVAAMQLDLNAGDIEGISECLRGLHRTRAHPIGQSLRGGTQTRGRLFARSEPEIRLLKMTIEQAVEEYWSKLPPQDPEHPLLRHRAKKPQLGGSWSVRLTDGGFHVAHVHPEGVVSSACYLVVPAPGAGREGWLEVGRPPDSLATGLSPLSVVEPTPGKMALFPSTLFHGTRPFLDGERLTSAFDVLPG